MRRFLRSAVVTLSLALGMAGTVALFAPAPQAEALTCDSGANRPTINKMDGGYYVSFWGTIKCPKKIANINTSLTVLVRMQKKGGGWTPWTAVTTTERNCIQTDRCPETWLLYIACGPDKICDRMQWKTQIAGSYRVKKGDTLHRIPPIQSVFREGPTVC